MQPRTLILRSAGTNCDAETAHAFELAGATSQSLHINRLLENPRVLDDFQILALPGGFSYGDDISAGRILATQIMRLIDPLKRFIESSHPIIGICNGFQVLIKTALLPALPDFPGQSCTLTHNDSQRFMAQWVSLKSISQKCIWTKDLGEIELPIAHGEGKFVPASDAVRRALHENDLVALTYSGLNPNGSNDAIAGICDPSGLVLGLMPHPERHVSALQHPAWSSRKSTSDKGPGLRLFEAAVEHVTTVGSGL